MRQIHRTVWQCDKTIFVPRNCAARFQKGTEDTQVAGDTLQYGNKNFDFDIFFSLLFGKITCKKYNAIKSSDSHTVAHLLKYFFKKLKTDLVPIDVMEYLLIEMGKFLSKSFKIFFVIFSLIGLKKINHQGWMSCAQSWQCWIQWDATLWDSY